MTRNRPNILITGTPGTGKSTLSETVASSLKFSQVNVTELCKEKQFYDGFDEDRNCYVIDEDKLLDYMEELIAPGGFVVDYHGCDFFPERWFDLVFVLRTDNGILFKRLEARGYTQEKITENIDCEIFQVLVDEAKESYDEDIVYELQSNSVDDMDDNVDIILEKIQQLSN